MALTNYLNPVLTRIALKRLLLGLHASVEGCRAGVAPRPGDKTAPCCRQGEVSDLARELAPAALAGLVEPLLRESGSGEYGFFGRHACVLVSENRES